MGELRAWRSLWAKRLGAMTVATVLSLLGAELVLRVAGIEASRWAHANHVESADKRAVIDAYPDDPRGHFDLDLRNAATRARWAARGLERLDEVAPETPHAVGLRFDEHLCRADSGIAPSEGAARVLVIGDSFAEGQGVRGPDTFSARLDRALGDVSVINCGRRGYDFPTLADAFEARLDAHPADLVLYAMVLNDAERGEAFAGRQSYLDDWIVDRRRMLATGEVPSPWTPRLYAVLADRIESARVGQETLRWYMDLHGAPNADGWAATQAHIVRMRDAARARGADFLVALLPLLVALDGDYPFTATHREIARALRARGLAFHDTTPALLGQSTEALWVHPTDHHPNERAHALIAEDLRPVVEAAVSN